MVATSDQPCIAIASYAERRPLRGDDLPLRDALVAKGVSPVPIVWDDDDPDWSRFDACLIRSVSDYHRKYDQFVSWTNRVGRAVPLWNSLDLTLWNADKSYLHDLAVGGVPTIPSLWLAQGNNIHLTDALKSHDWDDIIIKPRVGLGAQNLYRLRPGTNEAQLTLSSLLRRHDVIVQPFLHSVVERGESSLIYIDGELTHAVRKHPPAGDFRVQKNWGGTSELCEPTAEEIAVATAALGHLDSPPLFARIDLVTDPSGEPALIELELIEPDLFFRHEPAAAVHLADAIASRLSTGR